MKLIRHKHNFEVGDIVENKNYPKEKAEIIVVDGDQLRVSHPYGKEWYQASDCTLIKKGELEF